MATFDNLPVYKVSYDLLTLLFKSCRNMQRDYRFTLGESMKNELLKLMMNVFRANSVTEKREYIHSARENLELIRLLLRLSHDLKQTPLKDFVMANTLIDSMGKQLTAWHKSVIKNAATPP